MSQTNDDDVEYEVSGRLNYDGTPWCRGWTVEDMVVRRADTGEDVTATLSQDELEYLEDRYIEREVMP